MLLHTGPLFSVYFGDAQDNIYPDNYLGISTAQELVSQKEFDQLRKFMNVDAVMFLHQVHGARGHLITPTMLVTTKPFTLAGDYLLTADRVAVGVLTADCLPIVMHDTVHNVAAVVHAGWRSSMSQVAVRALEHMQALFNTDLSAIRILFGPSAKSCCYEVAQEFLGEVKNFSFGMHTVRKQSNQLFFDVPLFNKLQLESIGVRKESFCLDYNLCTMCNPSFFSHRRQQGLAGRQMTVVALK